MVPSERRVFFQSQIPYLGDYTFYPINEDDREGEEASCRVGFSKKATFWEMSN